MLPPALAAVLPLLVLLWLLATVVSGTDSATPVNPETAQTLCQFRQAESRPDVKQDAVDAWMKGYDRLTRPQVANKNFTLYREAGFATDRLNWTNVKVDADKVAVDLYINSVWDIDQRAGSFKIRGYLRLRCAAARSSQPIGARPRALPAAEFRAWPWVCGVARCLRWHHRACPRVAGGSTSACASTARSCRRSWRPAARPGPVTRTRRA